MSNFIRSAPLNPTLSKSWRLLFRKTEHNSEIIRNELFVGGEQPKGYMENIIRLRKANEEKKKLNIMKEMQGVPQNYTGKMTKFKPFKLKTEDEKKKSNPSMLIEVTIAPGKRGMIPI
jgi:hypothetical protein